VSADGAAGGETAILPLRFESVGFDVGGLRLLDGIDFEVPRGAPVVVLGPNGAGKSLLLRLAHGLLVPTRGRVRWGGADAASPGAHQAMVFSEAVLLRRSVAANVAHALSVRGVSGAEREARVQRVLADTGLAVRAAQPARSLSSGERQRLALARAWAVAPEVLFLDEPTGSLDPAATAQVEAIVGRLAAEGRQIVMTTHDLGQARRIAGRVLFLHRGRLLEDAPAGAFFAGPASDEARAFLAGDLVW